VFTFTALERSALRGDAIADDSLRDLSLGNRWRVYGLQAWVQGDDLEAVRCFARSVESQPRDTFEWAVSARLHGLALVRVQREVEGTFVLERADAVLERFGGQPFTLEALLEG
jgi:hypothetical protein